MSVGEIQKTVLKSPFKSCMLDPIPTSLLKECKSELMPIITKIVNLSIETGEMPKDFKHAIITPLIKKKGLELIYKNIRPVSGLPFLSKVIEKVVSQQLTQHVTASNLNEQGSVLGPQLYCDYTIPLGIIIRNFLISFHMYADDSQLYK